MSEELKNSKLPAGAIVEELPDGGAVRNDGVRLGAANKNPWYVLATIHGEQGGGLGPYLKDRNRQAWNGWVYKNSSKDKARSFAKDNNLSQKEITDILTVDLKDIETAFLRRLPNAKLPEISQKCNFEKTHFLRPVNFDKYIFVNNASFNDATFSKPASFNDVIFNGYTSFISATFGGSVYFNSSIFNGVADFRSVTFNEYTSFRSVTFGVAAYFRWATFNRAASFSSAEFKAETSFVGAQFKAAVPAFHAAQLYDDTTFTLPNNFRDNWPPLQGDGVMAAAEQKRAYNRLRLFMNKTLQIDEEQFFHRQEMRCKALTENWYYRVFYWLYEKASDFGNSVWQPFYLLSCLWVFGAIAKFAPALGSPWPSLASVPNAMAWSFANLFPFFGFQRLYFEKPLDLHWLLKLTGGGQTVCGFILLFLLGLGLRNRFRLR